MTKKGGMQAQIEELKEQLEEKESDLLGAHEELSRTIQKME